MVRLTGDASSYLKMLKDSQDATKKAAEEAKAHAEAIQGFGDHLGKFVAGITGAIGATGVTDFLKESKQEWLNAETAVFKLNSVLKANGREVGELSERYARFATQTQKVTTYSDETVLGLLKTAETYGLTGAKAEEAVKSAMALAAATDTGSEGALRMSRAMAEGNTELAMSYARMIPQLRGIKNEQEFTLKYQQLVKAGQITLNDELKTGEGRAKNFANQFSDMQEEIGKIYASTINPVKMLKKEAMGVWNGLGEGTKEGIVVVASYGAQIVATIGVVTALREAWELVGGSVARTLTASKGMLIALATNPLTWVAAAAVGVGYLVARVTGLTKAMSQIHSEIKRAESLRTDLAKNQGGKDNKELAAIGNLTSGRDKAYADAIAKASEQMQDYEKKITKAQEVRSNFFADIGDYQEAGASIKDYTSKIEGLRDRIEKLKDAAKGNGGIDSAIGNIKGMQDMLKALKEQSDALGMNNFQLAKQKALKEGLNDAQAGKVAFESVELDKAKNYKTATDAVAAFIQAQKDARETLGMTEGEKELWKLRQDLIKNRSGSYIDTKATDAAAAQLKLTEAATKEQERWNKLVADNKSLLEELQSPQDKLTERIADLDEMLLDNMLTWEEYGRAVDKANESIMGTAAAMRDAAKAGSVEANARIDDYFSKFKEVKNAPNQGAAPQAAVPLPKPDGRDLFGNTVPGGSGDATRTLSEILKEAKKGNAEKGKTINLQPANL